MWPNACRYPVNDKPCVQRVNESGLLCLRPRDAVVLRLRVAGKNIFYASAKPGACEILFLIEAHSDHVLKFLPRIIVSAECISEGFRLQVFERGHAAGKTEQHLFANPDADSAACLCVWKRKRVCCKVEPINSF